MDQALFTCRISEGCVMEKDKSYQSSVDDDKKTMKRVESKVRKGRASEHGVDNYRNRLV